MLVSRTDSLAGYLGKTWGWGPPGFHTTVREPKRAHLNTHKHTQTHTQTQTHTKHTKKQVEVGLAKVGLAKVGLAKVGFGQGEVGFGQSRFWPKSAMSEDAWLKMAHLCVSKIVVIHVLCLVPCRT